MKEKILIVGSGGREDSLGRKLAESPRIGNIYVAPGNSGTRDFGENVLFKDVEELARFATDNKVGITVVGSEIYLAAGIVDIFRAQGLRIVGPTQDAARIETSKLFAKELMIEKGIPTAPFQGFDDYEEVRKYINSHGALIVVKADGLASGKGVYPCASLGQTEKVLKLLMIERVYGEAGARVIVEDFKKGQEVSVQTVCDGKTALMFPTAQDYKKLYEGDEGPNTGGMGAFGPVPGLDDGFLNRVKRRIVEPTLQGLARHKSPFTGFLYPGLMITEKGEIVLEYNARLGDPETQVIMSLLKTDLFDILEAQINGTLANLELRWNPGFAVCIALVSEGYGLCNNFETGYIIEGSEEAKRIPGIAVSHGATRWENGKHVTAGGRVIYVTKLASTLKEAQIGAIKAAESISFKGKHFRKDIALLES